MVASNDPVFDGLAKFTLIVVDPCSVRLPSQEFSSTQDELSLSVQLKGESVVVFVVQIQPSMW